MRNRCSAIYRLLVRGLVVSSLLIIGLSGYYSVDPVHFRKTVFQPAREILFMERELQPLSHWDKIDSMNVPPGERVVISPTGRYDVKIVADLYIPRDKKNLAPAILLLHGSSPWGRKNGFIRFLSHNLVKKGWVVLAPDQRGFGDTENPKELNDPEAWDVKSDIERCIDYLLSNSMVDQRRLYVLGHSKGAGHAVETALGNTWVRGLILIGPPRFLDGTAEGDVTLWDRVRFSADRRLKKPVSAHLYSKLAKKMDIFEKFNGTLPDSVQKPILLIDGEMEGKLEKAFLRELVQEINPNLEYVTLPGAGHYVGVYNLFGAPRVYYRSDLFFSFMKIFEEFTSSKASRG